MFRRLAAAALGSLFALAAGCAPTCDEACRNTSEVCAEQFKANAIQFSVEACVTECNGNTGSCALEQRICVSEATSCELIGECPTCP